MSIESTQRISRFISYPFVFILLASLSVSGSAFAQGDAEAAGILEEVIVTAQKREESILDVPISVSTLSGEKLDVLTAGGADIRFLRGRIPSLNIESSFGRVFPRFYVRGWGNTDFDVNASQPVSLIYDDVVMENPMLKGFPIFDVERIEMLRGPQGTLFGRNTPAGVVNIRSVGPSQEKDGYFKFAATSNDLEFEGAIGGGLNENWSARLSIKAMDRDDWVDNGFTNKSEALGGHNEKAARLQLAYDGDGMEALFNLHWRDLSGTARLFRANIIRPGSSGSLVSDFDIDTVFIDGQNDQQLENFGGMARFIWDFGRTTFTSITGYEDVDMWSVGDIDGGYGCGFCGLDNGPGFLPFDAETGDGVPSHSQYTQEFRLASNDWGKLDWTAGFFYFNEDLTIITRNFSTLAGSTQNGFVIQEQDTDAWAFFGSVDYDWSEDTVIKVGMRYSDDSKDFYAERFQHPFGAPNTGPIPAVADDSEISWDASITTSVTDNVNVYGRVAKGFRAPSIQGRILFGETVSIADSETVISLETGIKMTFHEGRGRLGFNLFHYSVDDAQLTAVGGEANFNQVINANEVVGQGFELDFEFLPVDNLLVTMGLSFNDTEIKDQNLAVAPCGSTPSCSVSDPAGPVAGSVLIGGNSLPQAPEWVFNATARWSKEVTDGEVYVYGDYFYRDDVNFFLYEAREFTGQSLEEFGIRFGYAFDEYDVAVFGRNIFGEEKIVGAIDFNNLTGFVNEPKTWGIELRRNFNF